jgi:hypothetical protein
LGVTTTPVARGRSSVSVDSSKTSLTFASIQTSAPRSTALSSIIWSNRSRGTCHVCEFSRGSRSSKKNGWDSLPLAVTNCTLYFFTKSLFRSLGSMPSRSKTQYVSGISDSPM